MSNDVDEDYDDQLLSNSVFLLLLLPPIKEYIIIIINIPIVLDLVGLCRGAGRYDGRQSDTYNRYIKYIIYQTIYIIHCIYNIYTLYYLIVCVFYCAAVFIRNLQCLRRPFSDLYNMSMERIPFVDQNEYYYHYYYDIKTTTNCSYTILYIGTWYIQYLYRYVLCVFASKVSIY